MCTEVSSKKSNTDNAIATLALSPYCTRTTVRGSFMETFSPMSLPSTPTLTGGMPSSTLVTPTTVLVDQHHIPERHNPYEMDTTGADPFPVDSPATMSKIFDFDHALSAADPSVLAAMNGSTSSLDWISPDSGAVVPAADANSYHLLMQTYHPQMMFGHTEDHHNSVSSLSVSDQVPSSSATIVSTASASSSMGTAPYVGSPLAAPTQVFSSSLSSTRAAAAIPAQVTSSSSSSSSLSTSSKTSADSHNDESVHSTPNGSSRSDNDTSKANGSTKKVDTTMTHLKPFHEEKWAARYKELKLFFAENGHSAVPHTYPKNPQLARWVKRQRRQYKMLQSSQSSSMTPERLQLLNDVEFVWDSHEANWCEKYSALVEYKQQHNTCHVPSTFTDKKLATWVKCQRRQYKLFFQGRQSAMSQHRIRLLESIQFDWEVRPTK